MPKSKISVLEIITKSANYLLSHPVPVDTCIFNVIIPDLALFDSLSSDR